MRTRDRRTQKINVITLGCSKNLYDSEQLMGQLRASGKEVVHEGEPNEARTVVINTCGFIESAKEESVQTILEYAALKEEGMIENLFVTGCLSERYKPDLEKEIPNVNEYFGTRDLPRLLKALGANYQRELVGERLLSTPSHYAYLKISEGCDRPCSFCAIPLMRGGHKSTPIEDLVQEAERLVLQGVSELLIIAQDTTYYGLDLYGKRRLADLLQALEQVSGIRRIRLHYAFPAGFPEDVLDVMAASTVICPYLDMPLQHISDPVLKSMRRGTTRAKTDALLRKIRERIPGVAIRTTLIVGYPGETEAHFQELCDWVREQRFDRLGVFTYSHEEQTHAFNLVDDVPEEVKQQRANEIMEIQSEISAEKNQELIGRELEVSIDRIEGAFFVGRTIYDSPEVDNEVLIQVPESHHLPIGSYAKVQITGADTYDLFASFKDD